MPQRRSWEIDVVTDIEGGHIRLYNGDDLANAAQRSRIEFSPASGLAANLPVRLWRDLRNARLRDLLRQSTWVSGRLPGQDGELTILFDATRRTLEYCAETILGPSNWRVAPAPVSGIAGADLIIADRVFVRKPATPLLTIATPPWVRLELDLGASWQATLDALPVAQLKRVARFLRRFGYRTTVDRGEYAMKRFREDFFLPDITRRFGTSAIIESEQAFLSDSRNCLRLNLVAGDLVVASNILKADGTRLLITRGARNPAAHGFKGQMDALDYFTLLLAQVGGFRILDFGLSRPHLEDGPLRYKVKWGARIVPGGGAKSDIRIICPKMSPAVIRVLERNRFLERERDGFILRVVAVQDGTLEDLPALVASARVDGIARIDVLHPADRSAVNIESPVPLRSVPVPWLT